MDDPLVKLFEEHMDRVVKEIGLTSMETAEATDSEGEDFYGLSIITPSINLYLHYLNGVLVSLESSNIIVAFSSLRGMLESIATVAYFEVKDPKNPVYNKFLKSGRIYNKLDRKWQEVSKREQIRCLDSLTSRSSSWVKLYDIFCSGIHFSNLHFVLTFDDLTFDKKDGVESAKLITRIGMNKMDEEEIKTIIETIEELCDAMCQVLANQSKQRNNNSITARRFSYKPYRGNLFPRDFIEYMKSPEESSTSL